MITTKYLLNFLWLWIDRKPSSLIYCNHQELDITATDLNQATILDILTRVPALQWVSAGQLDGMNDAVLTQWMNSGKCATLRALDLDSSDNVTEDMLGKFLERWLWIWIKSLILLYFADSVDNWRVSVCPVWVMLQIACGMLTFLSLWMQEFW